MNFNEVGTQATTEKKGCGNQDNCQTKLQCSFLRNTSKLPIFKVITTREKNLLKATPRVKEHINHSFFFCKTSFIENFSKHKKHLMSRTVNLQSIISSMQT
uniref:Uncharacterized protein n=1 Tax=Micrurus lemniscatus lemniscatus TaxID=129467 RepID=A0A2D4JB98_MICLE